MKNPFPGPLPYRAADRERFFGRTDLARKLQATILASRCVTVYGPSAAGKSSLLQAAVFPMLVERHDVRMIRVDAWPEGEEPTRWLASVMHAELGLGEMHPDAAAKDVLNRAVRGAVRTSSRLLVLYLDQLEQLLFSGRPIAETEPFFDSLEELLDMPLRSLRVVLSLREDYLGRFRDRMRDMRRITENGFRVGPLDVASLTEAVVLSAAAGEPPQTWSIDELRNLMLQVRVPGQAATDNAEAQAAYAQIICRALFHERARGNPVDMTEAEPILRGYIESALVELGPLREKAQQLLEDELVGADGGRTLRTEKELRQVIAQSDLVVILKQLEGAAILRAAEHQGSRYFEIGHDWLALWVYERRVERERIAEQERIAAEQAEQLALSRAQQRQLRRIAVALFAITVLIGAAAVLALSARTREAHARREAEDAQRKAENAERDATLERNEANDLRVMAGVTALRAQGQTTAAVNLLKEVKTPAGRRDWVMLANTALEKNALFVTLRGHRRGLVMATFSPNGQHVLTASADGTARIFEADGTGEPLVLEGHQAPLTFAAFSPVADAETLRVLTTSLDGSARIWTVRRTEISSIVLPGKTSQTTAGAWSPDGKRVAVAAVLTEPTPPGRKAQETFVTRVHGASDGVLLGEHAEHKARVHGAAFLDDTRVVTVSDDGSARVWNGETRGKIESLPGHSAPVLFVTVNQTKGIVVTTSSDAKARVFTKQADGTLRSHATLAGHTRAVVHAAISTDGKFVATASADKSARVWNVETPPKKGDEVVFDAHGGLVTFVAFRGTDAHDLATASTDNVGRVFRMDQPDDPLVFSGHDAPLRSIAWNPKGDRLVTAASDRSQSLSADHTAKIWRADRFSDLARISKATNTRLSKGTFRIASFGSQNAAPKNALAAPATAFAAAFADTTVTLHDRLDDEDVVKFSAPAGEMWDFVSAVAPTPDGKRVAIAVAGVASKGAQPGLADTGHALYVFQESDREKPIQRWNVASAIRHLAWNNAGDRLVAAMEDGTAVLFGVGNAAPIVFQGHTRWLTSAAFSPDGKYVVTTSLDRSALIFDVAGDGKPMRRYEHPDAVYSAAFDPTSQWVVTTCADGKLRIFDVAGTGTPVELDGQTGPLHRIVISADGTRIAATTTGTAILVWSSITWPLRNASYPFVIGGPTMEPTFSSLTFVDRGQRLVAAGWDRIYTWQLDVDALLAELRDNNRECLSVPDQIAYLNRTFAAAQNAFQACELDYRRGRPNKPVVQGPDDPNVVVARLLVLPWEADVAVDGVPYRRRDAIIELAGKLDEKKKVRVFQGTEGVDVEVTIGASGAKPSKIDLNAFVALKKRAAPAPGEPSEAEPFDPLMPDPQ